MREWACQYKTFLNGEFDRIISRHYLSNHPLTREQATELARDMNRGKPVEIARPVFREVTEWMPEGEF